MKLKRVYVQNGRYFYVQDLEERNPKTGRPKQKWVPLTRVEQGDAALVKALDELLGRAPEQVGNMPALLNDFRAVHLPGLNSFEVRKEYERMYDVIAKGFRQFDAGDVEPGDVIKFLNDNFTGKQNTRGKYKARLSTFFSWCVLNSRTGVKVNPCREIQLSAPPKRRGKINSAIYWKLYDALTPMGQCFLELTYLSRQRPTEIRLLRESHIGPADFPDYIHFVPTKTEDSSGEEVHVLITPEIRACLDRTRALRPKKKVELLDRHRDPFIIQTREGDGYTKTGLYEVWRDALVKVGLQGRNITTRDIRSFALAQMERMGVDMREIQKVAAHSTIATTEGYLEQHRDRLSDVRMPLPNRPVL